MKKIFVVLLCFILICSSVFAKKRDTIKNLSNEVLTSAEKLYGVNPFKMPSQNYVTLEDKFVRFGNYNIFGGDQILESFTITQKRKTYVMKIQDASTTVSYGWEAYFKLINDENKVVQVIHKKDMEDAIFALYDCDFDGYDDLIFYTSSDKYSTKYHIYYWNQTMKRFDKSPDKVTSPFYDTKNKLVITSEISGNGEVLWEYWRIMAGGRKFVARVRLGVYECKPENGISLAFTNKKRANFETSSDVYLYDMLPYKEFSGKTEEEQKELIRQYNALMKKINGIN